MKIGILTVPFNNNYGGYLQAYALMTVLKKLGHEPTLIMRRPNKIKHPFLNFTIKNMIKTVLTGKRYSLKYEAEKYFLDRGQKMITFLDTYIQPQTKYLYSKKELRAECKNRFDAYIVGSDQVWRAIYVPDIKNYFLDFTKGWNVLRIAYAASFGKYRPEYTLKQQEICGELISRFDAISVREDGGIDTIHNFNWNVKNETVTLDPTMLLLADDYKRLLPTTPSLSFGKIFCYVLDAGDVKESLIGKVCSLLNKERFDVLKSDGILVSVEDWLCGIRDADYIVTDSFHGTVFSIIFNKPFFVYVNKNRGAERFKSLLENFNLGYRMVENIEQVQSACSKVIDWRKINKKINAKRNASLSFLQKALCNHDQCKKKVRK